MVESLVANLTHGYAGTLDTAGRIHRIGFEPTNVLIDIKSGGYIGKEMALQLAAYRYAEFVGYPGSLQRDPMPRIDATLILQLRPDGYKLIPMETTPAEFDAFLAALRLLNWDRGRGRKVMGGA